MNNPNIEIFIYLIAMAVAIGALLGGIAGHRVGYRHGVNDVAESLYSSDIDYETRLGHEESI